MKIPDDYDPVAASYIERENAQINPLFALLQEVTNNRQEFETEATYRAEWLERVEVALFNDVLATLRADRRADEQNQQPDPPTI
jgi:hypothetical protein